MVTFESKPVVKVGGLGEVPPNLAAKMAERGISVTIVMPGHGRRGESSLGSIDGTGVDITSTTWKGVKFVLLGGDFLDDPRVYAAEVMLKKAATLARALGSLTRDPGSADLDEPQIIHFHDWHSVLSLLQAKFSAEDAGIDVGLVYHIHLLLKRTLEAGVLAMAGIDLGREHTVVYRGRKMRISVGEALELSRGLAERLGAIEADLFVTVSRAYLVRDRYGVLNTLGWDLEDKGGVIYNGTDWRYRDLLKEVLNVHGTSLRALAQRGGPSRGDLRRYLLSRALGDLPRGEPRIGDEELREKILDLLAPPFRSDGRVEPFKRDGPLALMTGRISRQKGIDVVLDAIPRVLERVGNARFLLLLLPVWGGEDFFEPLVEISRDYPENVRVVFGIAPSIYKLAHISGDVFMAPSLWEPFGIMALEGMASGNSIVASKVGGLSEIVLDVREWGRNGTGLLVMPGDPYDLSDAVSDMLIVMGISESTVPPSSMYKIQDELILKLLKEDRDLGSQIRESAMKRVEREFTWECSAEMALEAYEKALRSRRSDG